MPNVEHNYAPKEIDNAEDDTTAPNPAFSTLSPPPVTPPPPAPAPGPFPEPDPEPARVPEATARGEASEGADTDGNALRASHLPPTNTHLVSVQEKNREKDKKLNKSGGTKNGQLTAAPNTEDTSKSLKIVERVIKLPIVKCTANVYDFLKTNNLTGWTLNLAETTAKVTLAPAMYLASNFVTICNAPIRCVDATLCLGLDVMEAAIPCVKVNPNQMYATTRTCVAGCLCCCPRVVCSTITKMFPGSKDDVS